MTYKTTHPISLSDYGSNIIWDKEKQIKALVNREAELFYKEVNEIPPQHKHITKLAFSLPRFLKQFLP